MNRSEMIFYKASELCDHWIEWFNQQGRDVDWKTISAEIEAQWADDGNVFMRDWKMAVLTYPGFWHPSDIVTGSPDDIIWDTAYGMICNYLHEND